MICLVFIDMKSIYKFVVGVVSGVAACAGLWGCGDPEFIFEEPNFEIGVEFDFHDMEFDSDGSILTPEDEWPKIITTFSPCYFMIVEKPEWVSINRNEGLQVGKWYYGDGIYQLEYECVRNLSKEPRSGVVKVVVSNVGGDVPMGYIELDVPVYSFEGEFTVRQEGRAEEPYL